LAKERIKALKQAKQLRQAPGVKRRNALFFLNEYESAAIFKMRP
jgi:hypothetical protein